jgi:hypothetical protein
LISVKLTGQPTSKMRGHLKLNHVSDKTIYYKARGGKSLGLSDHGTIGPRKCFEFPENISPRKKNIIVKV